MHKIFSILFAVALISFLGLPVAHAEDETAVAERPTEAEPVLISAQEPVCDGNQGLIVKRISDNVATTAFDSTLFVLGCHDTIHIFPSEQTYKTWWPNFENVSYVEGAFIATKELEDNVTVRPGTYLVKQPTSPKVYAVEPNGILRWIPDEATAKELYGVNWNKIIIDLSDELFADYTIGENLTATKYPDGVIGYLPVEGRVVYLSGTSYYNLPGDMIDSMRLSTTFLVPLSATVMATYTDGGELAYDTTIAFPF